MRNTACLACFLALASAFPPVHAAIPTAPAGAAPPAEPTVLEIDDADIALLLGYAAEDFRKHPPHAEAVRAVRFGQFLGDDGKRQQVLCGEFRKAGAQAWVRFATVRTDPYEQWLGAGSGQFCDRDDISWAGVDFSGDLQEQLDADATVSGK